MNLKTTKTVRILCPILRGRDIKKYSYNFAELYIIATFPSLKIDIEKYPAVKEHLLSFTKHRLEQTGEKGSRKKTNNEWFETQDSISYWEDFSKEKIIYPNMTKFLPFVYDNKGIVTNQKCFILTLKNSNLSLKYLLGFLNSNVAFYWILNNCPELQGGTRELSKIFFENIPIPTNFKSKNTEIIELVNQLIEIKSSKGSIEIIEKKLNDLMFEMFDFSKKEVHFINKKVEDN